MAPFGLARVVIEQVVALELEKCLWNLELPHIGHRMGHVIELRGIVDRPKKTGQIIEERVVPAANKDFDRLPVRRLQCDDLIGRDNRGEAAAGEIEKSDMGLVVAIHGDANFGWLQYAQIFV